MGNLNSPLGLSENSETGLKAVEETSEPPQMKARTMKRTAMLILVILLIGLILGVAFFFHLFPFM